MPKHTNTLETAGYSSMLKVGILGAEALNPFPPLSGGNRSEERVERGKLGKKPRVKACALEKKNTQKEKGENGERRSTMQYTKQLRAPQWARRRPLKGIVIILFPDVSKGRR